MQDWAGPIGLCTALTEPDRYARLFIFNTWLHHDAYEYGEGIRWWHEAAVDPERFGADMPTGAIVAGTMRRPDVDAESVRKAFDAPFTSEASKAGARRLPACLPFADPLLGDAALQQRAPPGSASGTSRSTSPSATPTRSSRTRRPKRGPRSSRAPRSTGSPAPGTSCNSMPRPTASPSSGSAWAGRMADAPVDPGSELDGYWPGPWSAEDGGPTRRQAPAGSTAGSRGLDLWPGRELRTTTRSTFAPTMCVLRDPGEVFLLCHTIGPDTVSWVERIDPVTLEPVLRSPDLPAGPFWPGGMAAHADGSPT